MKRITIGILAHVDAGKTTCIESMLYNAKSIRKLGRVDHQDAFLDYDSQERSRGITIYSKQAHYSWNDNEIYIIDTPGHVDFSSEMERSLQILDMAILLINGQDGVQSHTETIWKCLEQYHIPTLIFINKMDISYKEKEELINDLKKLSDNCIDLNHTNEEQLALINDDILNEYMENQSISNDLLTQAIYKRELFPLYFGSALKNEGIKELMDAITTYTFEKEYPQEFGAKVYKITNDDQGNRLTHMKITGGSLKAKDKINEEKVDQIRLYNGTQYQMIQEAQAGMVVAIKGLETFEAGNGFGFEKDSQKPLLNPYMNYELLLPHNVNALDMMRHLNILASQDPSLDIQYNEQTKTIHLRLMGSIQIEVIQKLIFDRTGIQVGFSTGRIVYKETIKNTIMGYGHFEPLRHYAEVHIKLEPLPKDSGIIYANEVNSDTLSQNWQHSIMTSLTKKEHRGVLIGAPITDMKITLIAGKAHLKHTESTDFAQASYRAIRQGLMKAESILLEPYYTFELKVPNEFLSKALYDLETKHAQVKIIDKSTIQGKGPVKTLINYQNEVIAYTKGKGKYTCQLDGYYPCENQEEIIEKRQYDPENDFRNPTGSVFCTHGSGYYVPWNEVEDHLHIPLKTESTTNYQSKKYKISEEEVQRVFQMTGGKNKNEKKQPKVKKKTNLDLKKVSIQNNLPNCLIVDGYNMIYSWQSLKEIAKESISSARDALIDLMSNYQGYKNYKVILVFDAYRVKDNMGSSSHVGNMDIIYTRSSQTADSYIEKAVHDLKKQYRISVATSDGLIQNSIFAQGASRISSRELELQVTNVNKQAMRYFNQ